MTRRTLVEPDQQAGEANEGQPTNHAQESTLLLDRKEAETSPIFEFGPEQRRFVEETAEAVAGLMD